MKTVQLSGSLRENVGKKYAKALRRNGEVPCVLYGSGEQTTFSVRTIDLEKLIFNPNVYFVEVEVEGKTKRAIIQDYQTHPVTDKPLHADFLEVFDHKPIRVGIPIRIVGNAQGVLDGGNLITLFRSLNIEGLPKDIPSEAEIDISPLKIGDAIRVEDVKIPGVKALEDPSAVIVTVATARAALKATTEEEEGEEDEEEEGEEDEEKTEE